MLQLLGRSVLMLSGLWGPSSLFIQVKNKIPIVWDGTKLDLRLGNNVAGSIRRYAVLSTQTTLLKQHWFQVLLNWVLDCSQNAQCFTNDWTLVLPVLGDGNCCYFWLYSLHPFAWTLSAVLCDCTIVWTAKKNTDIKARFLCKSCRK